MITCSLMGGLGNQLFQTAVTLSLSLDNNMIPIFPPNPHQGCSRKINYNDTYFHRLERIKSQLNFKIFVENGFSYKPIQVSDDNINLRGYFQSEKYFEKHKKYILNTLVLPNKMIIDLNNKYKHIIECENTVSIHVRRGDYLGLQHVHYVQTLDYYQEAIKKFPEDSMFVIFSDDIHWCKEIPLFKHLKNVQFIQDIDYNELYIMSRCKHNIIANSTFSWWAAYMNPNVNKIIIAPKIWFGPKGPNDLQDLIPPSWIII